MSKTTLVTQQVQLQEWFQMMQESKGRPQQILWMNGVKRIMGFLQLDIITESER